MHNLLIRHDATIDIIDLRKTRGICLPQSLDYTETCREPRAVCPFVKNVSLQITSLVVGMKNKKKKNATLAYTAVCILVWQELATP